LSDTQPFVPALLNAAGLNLQAVFAVADLPPALRQPLAAFGDYRQLILIGHGGRAMWQALRRAGLDVADPIDTFSRRVTEQWLAEQLPGGRYALLYPGSPGVSLQALGELAGWHHPSPFMVGINATWGSWFAYRALVLADSDFAPTAARREVAPCSACAGRDCVAACPAGALDGGYFALDKCIAWRRQPASSCRMGCPARLACPVAGEHRYSGEQMRHSYAISLRMIEQYT